MSTIDPQLNILAKAMSLRLQRHSAIAGNIANADTPGYRPRQVSFEEELQSAAANRNLNKISNIHGKTEFMDDGVPRADGNSVNLDKQMANLAENSIVYNASAEFLARKIKMLKTVIS